VSDSVFYWRVHHQLDEVPDDVLLAFDQIAGTTRRGCEYQI